MKNRKLYSAKLYSACMVAVASLAGGVIDTAHAQARFAIEQPRQSLADAVRAVGRATGTSILFDPALMVGRTADAISGELSVEEALAKLLVGTDLSVRKSGENSLIIQQSEDSKSTSSATSVTPAASATESPASGNNTQLEEIVVTSTRVARSGFTAPTPTTMLGSEDMQIRGATTIANLLNELPSVRPQIGGQGNASQNSGLAAINLRNLNTVVNNNTRNTRTLLLVDGRRFVPTTIFGAVDSNVVPSALVDRIELVTGGASAAWGSDAVAGVANFIMKKKLSGLQGNVQYGQSEHGDNKQQLLSLAWGTDFAQERGQFMAAVEYSKDYDRPTIGQRDWSNTHANFLTINGRNVFTSGLTLNNGTTGGVIINTTPSSPLYGKQFGAGGTLQNFNYGTGISPGNNFMQGGDGGWYLDRVLLLPPLERKNIYTRGSFQFTENWSGFAELSHAESATQYPFLPIYVPNAAPAATITVRPDNAYLSQQVKDIMTANNIASFSMGRINEELGRARFDTYTKTTRAMVGMDGSFGGSWKWSSYYTHGESRYKADVLNHLIVPNWAAALDAVRDVNGNIVCRASTIATQGAAPGCVPANPFGPGSLTQAVKNYVTGNQHFQSKYKQDVVAGSIQGEPFRTWAGDVSIVGGLEYRRESVNGVSDDVSAAKSGLNQYGQPQLYANGAFQYGNQKAIKGSYDTREVFAETVVPLLSKLPFAEQLDLNAAVRSTDYSTSGKVTTWKGGLTYKPMNSWLLRGTRSRDIRAPNLNELYASNQITIGTVTDYASGSPVTVANIQVLTRGNPFLKPEEADTTTLGIAWTPEFLPGFKASIDYFSIDLQGVITSRTAPQIVNACFGQQGVPRDATLCGPTFITRDANGRISAVSATNQNFNALKTSGEDFEVSYRFGIGAGRLGLRALLTNVREYVTDNGMQAIDNAGDTVGGPKWTGTFSATYQNGPWTVFAQERYIGKLKVNNTYTTSFIDDNDIPAFFYTDLSVTYAIKSGEQGRLDVFGKVGNVFDKDPPPPNNDFNANSSPSPNNGTLYDPIGRMFTVGLRFAF